MESTIGPSLSPIICSLSFHPSSPSLSVAPWQRSIKPTEQLAMKFGGFIIFLVVLFSVIVVASKKLKTEESKDGRVRVIGRVIEINMGDEELECFEGEEKEPEQ